MRQHFYGDKEYCIAIFTINNIAQRDRPKFCVNVTVIQKHKPLSGKKPLMTVNSLKVTLVLGDL